MILYVNCLFNNEMFCSLFYTIHVLCFTDIYTFSIFKKILCLHINMSFILQAKVGSRTAIDKTAKLLVKEERNSPNLSTATFTNVTYNHITCYPTSYQNEDRLLHMEADMCDILIVLDGHKGSSCVTMVLDYFMRVFGSKNWKRIISNGNDQHILLRLKELTKEADLEFFEFIQQYVDELETLKSTIPNASQ